MGPVTDWSQANDTMPTSFDQMDLIDLKNLRKIGDDTLVARLVDLFLQEVPPTLSRFEKAARDGTWGPAATAAHRLAGMLSHFGADRTVEILREFERLAPDGESQCLRDKAAKISAEITKIINLLGDTQRLAE